MQICLALLCDSLLDKPHSSAAVVDTSGNFDVLQLYAVLLARLQGDAEVLRRLGGALGVEGLSPEEGAARALDRVNLMRAFDLVGVMEAVGEVRDELEGRGGMRGAEDMVKEVRGETDLGFEKEKEVPRRTYVADSDEEDEMLFDDEPAVSASADAPTAHAQPTEDQDEILFLGESTDQRDEPPRPPPTDTAPQTQTQTKESRPSLPESDPMLPKPAFLFIDNLAHVITPLLQKDCNQGTPTLPSHTTTLTPPSNLTNLLLPPHPHPPNPHPHPPHPPLKPQRASPPAPAKAQSKPGKPLKSTSATVDLRVE